MTQTGQPSSSPYSSPMCYVHVGEHPLLLRIEQHASIRARVVRGGEAAHLALAAHGRLLLGERGLVGQVLGIAERGLLRGLTRVARQILLLRVVGIQLQLDVEVALPRLDDVQVARL